MVNFHESKWVIYKDFKAATEKSQKENVGVLKPKKPIIVGWTFKTFKGALNPVVPEDPRSSRLTHCCHLYRLMT